MKVIPRPAEVAREAIIIVAGSILAAYVVGQLPELKAWIKRQWDGAS